MILRWVVPPRGGSDCFIPVVFVIIQIARLDCDICDERRKK